MAIVLYVLALGTLLAWLSAAVHALLLVSHRRDDITLFSLAWRGILFYRADTWKPSGAGLHRRFLISVAALAGCILGTVLAAALTSHG